MADLFIPLISIVFLQKGGESTAIWSKTFQGNFRIADFVVFFEILEPEEARGVTHSAFQFSERISENGEIDRGVYFSGEKIPRTGEFHWWIIPTP